MYKIGQSKFRPESNLDSNSDSRFYFGRVVKILKSPENMFS